MNKYYLIGIPNCGKSTLGRLAAARLNMPYYDTDTIAYGKMNLEHPFDMFLISNQHQFMAEQRKAIIEIAGLEQSAIVATGAELALQPADAHFMQNTGKVIHIKRDAGIILNDLKNSTKSKLVLRELTRGDEIHMEEQAVELYAENFLQYEMRADFTVDNNGSQDEGAEALFSLISRIEKEAAPC